MMLDPLSIAMLHNLAGRASNVFWAAGACA